MELIFAVDTCFLPKFLYFSKGIIWTNFCDWDPKSAIKISKKFQWYKFLLVLNFTISGSQNFIFISKELHSIVNVKFKFSSFSGRSGEWRKVYNCYKCLKTNFFDLWLLSFVYSQCISLKSGTENSGVSLNCMVSWYQYLCPLLTGLLFLSLLIVYSRQFWLYLNLYFRNLIHLIYLNFLYVNLIFFLYIFIYLHFC